MEDAVGVYHVEVVVDERECFAVGDAQSVRGEVVKVEVATREGYGAVGEVDAGHTGAAASEAHHVGTDSATDFQDLSVTIATEVDRDGEVAKLVEAVIVERVEEGEGPDRLVGYGDVMDPLVPVVANAGGQCGHEILREFGRLGG